MRDGVLDAEPVCIRTAPTFGRVNRGKQERAWLLAVGAVLQVRAPATVRVNGLPAVRRGL